MSSHIAPVFIPLKRPPFFTAGLVTLLMAAAFLSAGAISELVALIWADTVRPAGPTELWPAVFRLVFWLGLAGLVLGRRYWVFSKPLSPIIFYDDHIELPRAADAHGSRSLSYSDILAVALRGSLAELQFIIESPRCLFHYSQEAFVDKDGPERVLRELRERISRLPYGQRVIEQMDRRRILLQKLLAIRPLATYAIIGVCAVFFGNLYLLGGLESAPFGLISWGANVPALVHDGDYFRLFAATFLHGNILHMLIAGLSLYIIGFNLERVLGAVPLILIFLITALAGAWVTFAYSQVVIFAGASVGVYGLAGALFVCHWRFGKQVPYGLRIMSMLWVVLLGSLAILPLMWPLPNMMAHGVGLVLGMAMALLFVARRRQLEVTPPRSVLQMIVLGILVALYGASLVKGVQTAAQAEVDGDMRVGRALLAATPINAESLNIVAWTWAITPAATPEKIDLAVEMATRAVDAMPDESAFHDTLAQALHRQGRIDEAIDQERRALELHDDAVYAAQLMRFFAARVAKQGVRYAADLGAEDVRLTESNSGTEQPVLHLELSPKAQQEGAARGLSIFALLRQGDNIVGLVAMRVGDGQMPLLSHYEESGPAALQSAGEGEARRFDIVAVEQGGPLSQKGSLQANYWPYDSWVEKLP